MIKRVSDFVKCVKISRGAGVRGFIQCDRGAGAAGQRRIGARRRRVPRWRTAVSRRLPAAILPAALRARAAPRQPASSATEPWHGVRRRRRRR
ncbi:hypothetical protein O3G_MSEX012803 [Manduca sexta]|uniref:Uncharacterized protein n=1 Tax=Manduca sexta TaxID=7130 RepID=A0A922CXQ1_MANSE|nr:hypothetical protein O3G_MSEX012803 [Manduca sexta]